VQSTTVVLADGSRRRGARRSDCTALAGLPLTPMIVFRATISVTRFAQVVWWFPGPSSSLHS